MTKVNIIIDSPQLQANIIMPQGKALTYLKSLKKTVEKDLKIQIKTIDKDENKSK